MSDTYRVSSLGESKQKCNMLHISNENKKMLERLQNQRTTYSTMAYETQHKERTKLLEKISLYPYILNRRDANNSKSPLSLDRAANSAPNVWCDSSTISGNNRSLFAFNKPETQMAK